MRKLIVAEYQGRQASVAWLSFQPDGSISFGLNDRAFYAPRLGANIGIFNAYNRVRLEYLVTADGAGMTPIQNPHFTYHPDIAQFHLTGNGDEDVFTGIMDPTIMLSQQPAIEWIRVTSRRISTLPNSRSRSDGIATETWAIPARHEDQSLHLAVDLVREPSEVLFGPWMARYSVPWFALTTQITVNAVPPQEASLAWFHEC